MGNRLHVISYQLIETLEIIDRQSDRISFGDTELIPTTSFYWPGSKGTVYKPSDIGDRFAPEGRD